MKVWKMNNKEELLNLVCDEALSAIYDYFQFAGDMKTEEYTAELMNKMTLAVKASIRFNNKLVKALEEDVIKLSPQASSMLNTFYSYYEQMPKTEEQVSSIGGTALIDVYTGMLQNITPLALLISTELSSKSEQ